MTTCPTLTLCDPNNPDVTVLVVDPGTSDAAAFVLPSLTPYTGTINDLVKCPAVSSGPTLLDCDGTELTDADTVTILQKDATETLTDSVAWLFGEQEDGTCVKSPYGLLFRDAAGQPWNDQNPNWLDPSTVRNFAELRIRNGIAGDELWRRMEDSNGNGQWHQVA